MSGGPECLVRIRAQFSWVLLRIESEFSECMNPSLFESLSDYDAQELKGGIDQTLNPSEFFFENNSPPFDQEFNFGAYVKNTDAPNRSNFNPSNAYGVVNPTNYGLKNKAQIPE